MNEAQLEAEIQARGLTAPRLTPEKIDAQIKHAEFHVFSGTTTTVCCLTLMNGYTVVGESACASESNFDEEIGRNLAYANARQKIWALEGYLLRNNLAAAAAYLGR